MKKYIQVSFKLELETEITDDVNLQDQVRDRVKEGLCRFRGATPMTLQFLTLSNCAPFDSTAPASLTDLRVDEKKEIIKDLKFDEMFRKGDNVH